MAFQRGIKPKNYHVWLSMTPIFIVDSFLYYKNSEFCTQKKPDETRPPIVLWRDQTGCRYATNFKLSKCANMQIWKFVNMKVSEYAHIYIYESFRVCTYIWVTSIVNNILASRREQNHVRNRTSAHLKEKNILDLIYFP